MSAEFHRIMIAPPCELSGPMGPFDSETGWFVRVAEKPFEYQGKKRFSHFEITVSPWDAAVYSADTARNVLAILRELYPAARLVHATFADWIECMPAN